MNKLDKKILLIIMLMVLGNIMRIDKSINKENI